MKFFTSGLGGENKNIVFPPSYQKTSLIVDNTKWTPAMYRDDKFIVGDGILQILDLNDNVKYERVWAETDTFWCAKIFENGNILIWTNTEQLFLTDTKLSRMDEKIMKDTDGSDFVIDPGDGHVFFPLYIDNDANYDGVDAGLWVWGAYTNIFDSYGVPVYIFYTPDYGETLKVALNLTGFSPYFYPRHMHDIAYNKFDNTWHFNTGDFDGDLGFGIGTYDVINDTWVWEDVFKRVIDGDTEHLKTTFMYFREIDGDTWWYYGAEMRAPGLEIWQGIWRAKVTEFHDTTKHEHILKYWDYGLNYYTSSGAVNKTNGMVILTTGLSGTTWGSSTIIFAKDWGHGEVGIIDVRDYVPLIRIQNLNGFSNDGYVRMNTDAIFENQKSTVFFRPGTDLLTDMEVIIKN